MVVRYAQKADKFSKSLEEERYSRMVAEETLQKNDAKLTTYQEQLKDTQDKISKITDVLEQEKGLNSDLKKQYDELTESKAKLEMKLAAAIQEKAVAVAALQAQPAAQPAAVPATSQPATVGH
jgi:chromosome segregation ATPase